MDIRKCSHSLSSLSSMSTRLYTSYWFSFHYSHSYATWKRIHVC